MDEIWAVTLSDSDARRSYARTAQWRDEVGVTDVCHRRTTSMYFTGIGRPLHKVCYTHHSDTNKHVIAVAHS